MWGGCRRRGDGRAATVSGGTEARVWVSEAGAGAWAWAGRCGACGCGAAAHTPPAPRARDAGCSIRRSPTLLSTHMRKPPRGGGNRGPWPVAVLHVPRCTAWASPPAPRRSTVQRHRYTHKRGFQNWGGVYHMWWSMSCGMRDVRTSGPSVMVTCSICAAHAVRSTQYSTATPDLLAVQLVRAQLGLHGVGLQQQRQRPAQRHRDLIRPAALAATLRNNNMQQ